MSRSVLDIRLREDSPVPGRPWTPSTAARRAAEVLRQEGAVALWFKILGETVYRRLALYARSLEDPIPEPRVEPRVRFALLQPGDLEHYLELRSDADPKELPVRLERGDRCFVSWLEGRIAHATWVATERHWIEYLEREVALGEAEAMGYEMYTAPEFRGRGIATEHRIRMLGVLREEGRRRAFALPGPENVASVRLVEKVGYRRIGLIGYVRLGGHRHDFCRVLEGEAPPGAPAVPARLERP